MKSILFRVIHKNDLPKIVEVYINENDNAFSSHNDCDIEEVDHGIYITYRGKRICFYACPNITPMIQALYLDDVDNTLTKF